MSDQRVSVLAGDRLCTGCGYNLTGQPVVREAHYQMLIVRCPECGTVASVQEYPLLGRWAGRWAAVLAASWFVAALVLMLATAVLLTAAAGTIGWAAASRFTTRIAQLQNARYEEAVAQGNVAYGTTVVSEEEIEALLADAGGWAGAADFQALSNWVWLSVLAFAIGCFWATFLAHLRRPWLILVGLLLVALAAAIKATGTWGAGPAMMMQYAWFGYSMATWPGMQTYERIVAVVAYLSLAFACLPLCAGLWLGRSTTRGLIRALLPPRMRSALALLWTADGLEPPSARRGPARGR